MGYLKTKSKYKNEIEKDRRFIKTIEVFVVHY